ncbi:Csu type fimbrial protein [Allosphingosinicella sp.]|uniref:Csu type fimbrial protein n=1 Tax=Allosphingosinicella sp. TaxID=2823234 RepID=UPI0039C85A93
MRRISWGVALGALISSPAGAACFLAVTPITFDYNPISAVTSTASGQIQVTCTLSSDSGVVYLSKGDSNDYSLRKMSGKDSKLNYNLFTSSTYSLVWGDGTGGTGTRAAAGRTTTILPVYGRIPGGQLVSGGSYTDAIIITFTY